MNATAYTAFDLHNARLFVIACQNAEAWAAAYQLHGTPADLETFNECRRRADEYANRMPRNLHRDITGETLNSWDAAHDLIDKLDAVRREN